jgi:hypothetical protein
LPPCISLFITLHHFCLSSSLFSHSINNRCLFLCLSVAIFLSLLY